MRHFGILDEELQRGFEAQGMMGSLGVIKDKIIGQSVVKEGFIVDDVEVVIDEFLLDGAIVAFDEAIDFRAVGIREEMRDFIRFELIIDFT